MEYNKFEVYTMIGDVLRNLRKERNLTQQQLSDILGIAQTTYAGYENNKHEPSLEILIKLADYYKVSLDYLCERYKQ